MALPVKAGQVMWVACDRGDFLQGVARFCEAIGNEYRVGLRRRGGERRQHERVASSATATLNWNGVSLNVVIRNQTVGGLQLDALKDVPVPTIVRLSGGGADCLAVTRYCRQVDDHYLIGIEFLHAPDGEISRWGAGE